MSAPILWGRHAQVIPGKSACSGNCLQGDSCGCELTSELLPETNAARKPGSWIVRAALFVVLWLAMHLMEQQPEAPAYPARALALLGLVMLVSLLALHIALIVWPPR